MDKAPPSNLRVLAEYLSPVSREVSRDISRIIHDIPEGILLHHVYQRTFLFVGEVLPVGEYILGAMLDGQFVNEFRGRFLVVQYIQRDVDDAPYLRSRSQQDGEVMFASLDVPGDEGDMVGHGCALAEGLVRYRHGEQWVVPVFLRDVRQVERLGLPLGIDKGILVVVDYDVAGKASFGHGYRSSGFLRELPVCIADGNIPGRMVVGKDDLDFLFVDAGEFVGLPYGIHGQQGSADVLDGTGKAAGVCLVIKDRAGDLPPVEDVQDFDVGVADDAEGVIDGVPCGGLRSPEADGL